MAELETTRPTILAGYMALALKIQEASDIAHSTVRDRLQKAVQDAHKGTGKYAYFIDHTGDGESGNCIYQCDGQTKSAPYEISDGDGTADTSIDLSKSKVVIPTVSYPDQADDCDHYSRMEESFQQDKTYDSLPLYERFISSAERKNIPDEDFAGKNRSYPIKTQADVDAAFHAIGRAGSDNYSPKTIRANIIKIAKRKGFSLPASAQDGGDPSTAKESMEKVAPVTGGDLKLIESAGADFLAELPLRESARTSYPVKLISPGTGTTAHYPEEVLERDGPRVFRKGTLMYWNHATAAEEAARPEGDLNNLAAILTSDARYEKNGAKGPGLYAEAKVMADYAQKIEERAPHIGLSIRAGGKGSGKTVNGKPELKSIDYAESVDYVTKAGRGGLALAEAAREAGLLPALETTPMKTKEAGKKECADCKGTGDCATCSGTGKIAKASEAKAKGKAKAMTDCTDCQGSGDCATCDGDGTVMESARGATGDTMNEATFTRLLEAALKPVTAKVTELETKMTESQAQNKPLLERALKGEATAVASAVLGGITMREAGKALVIADCLKNIPTKNGQLDEAIFREAVTARAKEIAPALGEGSRVIGLGSAPVRIDAKEAAEKAAEVKEIRESAEDIFADLMGGNKQAAHSAVYKGVAA